EALDPEREEARVDDVARVDEVALVLSRAPDLDRAAALDDAADERGQEVPRREREVVVRPVDQGGTERDEGRAAAGPLRENARLHLEEARRPSQVGPGRRRLPGEEVVLL